MSYRQLRHEEISNRKHSHTFVLVCDGLTNPVNTGMLFRLAESFGFEKMYLSQDTPTPSNKKLRKAARSATTVVAWETSFDTVSALLKMKQNGFLLAGLEITTNSMDIRQFDFSFHPKIALVLGSERQGISQAVLEHLDVCLEIPLYGRGTSINVATAAAIAMFQMAGQAVIE